MSPASTIWFRRLAKTVIALLLLLILILVTAVVWLPKVGLYYADQWYQSQGEGYQLKLGDYHFSPFEGKLQLNGLTLTHPDQENKHTSLTQFDLVFSPKRLLDREIIIKRLHVSGSEISIRKTDAAMTVAGLKIPLDEADSSSTSNTPSDDVKIEENENTDNADHTGNQITNSSDSNTWKVAVDSILFSDHNITFRDTVVDTQVVIQHIDIAPFRFEFPLQNDVNQTSVSSQSKSQNLSDLTLSIDLQLSVESLSVKVDNPIKIQSPLSVKWEGALESLLSHPKIVGNFEFNHINLQTGQDFDVLMEGLIFNQIVASTENIKIEKMMIEQLNLAQSVQTDDKDMDTSNNTSTNRSQAFSLQQYAVYEIDYSFEKFKSMTSGKHEFNGLNMSVIRNKDQTLTIPPFHIPLNEEQAEDHKNVTSTTEDAASKSNSDSAGGASDNKEEENSNTAALEINIDGIQQIEGGKSNISISDYTVSPPYNGTLSISQFEINRVAINSLQSIQPIEFVFESSLDAFNKIKLKTDLSYINEVPNGKLDINIEQMDMVPFNGYVIEGIGYQIQKGMLQMDGNITVNKGELAGSANILVKNSKLEPADDSIIDQLSKKISMPVDTALSLLRDDNHNIRISLPISGDITKPDVGLDDLTQQIGTLAIKTAAIHYLKQSIQPFGTLISLANYAGSHLMAIKLDAIHFETNESKLLDEHKALLDKVKDIMVEKTELELQVCPFVSAQEVEASGDDWNVLGQNRASGIKQYLADFNDENDHSLSNRVTICLPQTGESSEVVLGF